MYVFAHDKDFFLRINFFIKNLLFIFFIVLLSLLTASRILGEDRDYAQYLDFYERVTTDYAGRFELGFVSLSLFIKSLGLDFWWLLFVSAFLSLLAKLYLITKLPNYLYWIFIYSIVLYPVHELTQIRVSIALGFGYLGLFFAVREGIKFRVVLFTGFAVLFHWTMLVFVPFIIFVDVFKRRSYLLLLATIVIPSVFLFSSLEFFQVLNRQVLHMLSVADENSANPFSSRNVVFFTILCIGIFNIQKLPDFALPWFYLSVFGLSIWFGLMAVPVFAHRIFELTIFSCFFWVNYLPRNSRIAAMALLALLAVYLLFRLIYIEPLFGPSR